MLVIGGDLGTPLGPYPDALSVIDSGLLPDHGVREVAIAGYPEGHPDIDDDGIKIGQKLVNFEGLLGGRPTRRLPARDSSSVNDA